MERRANEWGTLTDLADWPSDSPDEWATRLYTKIQTNYNGPSVYGYDIQVTYNIYTNPGGQLVQPGFSGIVTVENVTQVSSNVSGFVPHTGSGSTDDSQIGDTVGLTSNTPLPPGLQIVQSQDIGVGGFFVRNNTLTYSSTTATITNNGPFN